MLVFMKPLSHSDESSAYTLGSTTSQNVVDQKRNVIHLEPGLHTIISVTPQLVETSDNFVALEMWSRKCKMSYETRGMNLVKNYSRTGCEFECAFDKAVELCRCTPWYYANNFTNTSICDMFGGYCFDKVMSSRKYYRLCPDRCMEDCSGMQLTLEKSFRPINIEKVCKSGGALHKFFMNTAIQHFSNDTHNRLATGDQDQLIYLHATVKNNNISAHYGTLCKEFVEKYIAMITVETPTDTILLTSRDVSATFWEQVAMIGGNLGLFTGICMLHILDVFKLIVTFFKMISLKAPQGGNRIEISLSGY